VRPCAGITATAEVTGGSLDNMKLIGSGNADVAFTQVDTAVDAINGIDKFPKKLPIRALAVMVDEAAAPFAADVAILATADQAGILQRNAGLIVIAVERPCLHLAFGALAGMKPVMERMQAVIAPGADVAQCGLECIG